jgi:hypothetical protein
MKRLLSGSLFFYAPKRMICRQQVFVLATMEAMLETAPYLSIGYPCEHRNFAKKIHG